MNALIGYLLLMTGAFIAPPEFAVRIELPTSYQSVIPGAQIWFAVILENESLQDGTPIRVTYQLLQGSEAVMPPAHDTLTTDASSSFVATLATPPELPDGTYSLSITVSTPRGNATSAVLLQVDSKRSAEQVTRMRSLFDIIITIPDQYKVVQPAGEILTSIKLINIGSSGRIDVFLDYLIMGPDGATVVTKRETVAVETQANFVRTFDIPANAPPGMYTLEARLTYADGRFAASEHSFEVAPQRSSSRWYIAGAVALAFILVIAGLKKNASAIKKMQLRMRIRSIVRSKFHARDTERKSSGVADMPSRPLQ